MADILTTVNGVAFLRTPEANFVNLPDYDYPPSYLEIDGLRMHYLDVGPRDGPVALLMHGMPTWSFLNRGIIARLVAAGGRLSTRRGAEHAETEMMLTQINTRPSAAR